ncbi:hypothetical protein BCR32DRAFT_264717 [Anaeromyces robustus]|uniref:Uncharacterized protein n=1 Tax=Anaeromyces robustus TaxID=1754192 RepID=A0A1Y1XM44_9FUNG|nr:hypothetical protein BCR32DRAFT_264717 [Anaeromyces robustus]|eukprot:ORX86830.1 hypothetical protein BCR32DRAFT_264717 [Anaeromyces robustus]
MSLLSTITYVFGAIILGIGIGFLLIFLYKCSNKFFKNNSSNRGIPVYDLEIKNSTDNLIEPPAVYLDAYSNQKILQTSEEEKNINTINTINRLINRDKVIQQNNI